MDMKVVLIIFMLFAFGLVLNFLNRIMRPDKTYKNYRGRNGFVYLVADIILSALSNKYVQRNSNNNAVTESYQYKRKEYFITKPEHELYDLLVQLFGFKYYIFPQVRLSTLLDEKVRGQNWRGAWSHINRKSVDFVFCDKANIKPLLALELDDASHEKEERIERDEEVERILKDAQLPLIRIENHGQFDRLAIYREITEILGLP